MSDSGKGSSGAFKLTRRFMIEFKFKVSEYMRMSVAFNLSDPRAFERYFNLCGFVDSVVCIFWRLCYNVVIELSVWA